MNVEPPRAKAIFLEAVERHEPAQWPQYLDAACAGDASLRLRVEALLRAHAASAGLLDELGGDPGATTDLPSAAECPAQLGAAGGAADGVTADLPSAAECPGVTIGPYKLLEPIGAGGMGVVYMAQQTHPVRRKVALKIIKPGMDSWQVIARFEAERQALALMDHPNIAKVHDAGTTDAGLPYFVMELVKGIPVTDYCDKARLSVPERLDLFVLVCRAVQHAHQKGIIHRDLKPSNILVTEIDGAAVPKVIDFGVAKATGGVLTERTLFTGFVQMVGTPLYMSPEQADLSGVDVDTRSDIYALGVLLYELLTGTTPFDAETFRKAAFDEMRRMIREDHPQAPSTRLSSLGGMSSTVAANRHADLRGLSRSVHGELDWIVMKALEKDRNRRYETANDFAADLMRHLADEPVEACPPSAWYRFGKLARRNRVALTTAGLISLALVTGTAVATWQAIRATQAVTLAARREHEARTAAATATRALALAARREEETQRAAAESRAVLQFLVQDMLGASSPEISLGREPKVAEVLANAEKKIDTVFTNQPLVEGGVRQALTSTYLSLGRYDAARRHASRSYDLRRGLLGPDHPETLTSMNGLATALFRQGKMDDALKLYEQTLEIGRRTLGPEHRETLTSMSGLANVLASRNKTDDARKLYEQTLEIRRRTLGPEHEDTLGSMHNLARLRAQQGKTEEARKLYEQTLEVERRVLSPEHPITLRTMNNLAILLNEGGKTDDARKLYEQTLEIGRRVLGPEHPERWNSMYNLIQLLSVDTPNPRPDDRIRALELARKMVELKPDKPQSWKLLGVAEYLNGNWDAALSSELKCLSVGKDKGYAFQHLVIAMAHARRGDREEAGIWYRKVQLNRVVWLDSPTRWSDTPPWLVAEAEVLFGELPSLSDRHRVLEIVRLATETDPKHALPWFARALSDYDAGRWDEALEALERWNEVALKAGDESSLSFVEDVTTMIQAAASAHKGDLGSARSRYDRAMQVRAQKREQGGRHLSPHFPLLQAEVEKLLGLNQPPGQATSSKVEPKSPPK